MAAQPIPKVSSADVERVVRRDFSADRVAEVLAILSEYGTENWQREADRVRLAALKLAGGSVELLRLHIKTAKSDYRDVIAPAEYPNYGERMFRVREFPADEKQRIFDEDWKQYQEWLRP
ncbi:MAG: hypothetical protein M3362_21265 [Acidobacteriota bacterium]|nr:hypothetical protein [Acidobacteriota bacterium]